MKNESPVDDNVTRSPNNRDIVSQTIPVTIIPVNDTPTITLPDDFIFDEDNELVVDFTGFVDDVDPDNLTLSVTGYSEVLAVIDCLEVTFSATENWNGNETLTFTIDDNVTRATAEDSVIVFVTYVNDTPFVGNSIADFSFDEDTINSSIDLNIVFDDVDLIYGDELSFSYSGNDNIAVEITDGTVMLTPNPDWFGNETITFTATDNYSESISENVIVTIDPVNDPPILEITGTFVAFEDLPSDPYDFSEFCSQTYGETDILTLTADNSEHINVTITDFEVVFESDSLNWNGTEDITFYLDDNVTRSGRDVDSQTIEVTVLSENDPPFIILAIEDIDVDEDFTEIIEVDLNNHFDDPEEDILTYSVDIEDTIAIVSIGENILSISAIENLNGNTLVTVTADDNVNRTSRDTCETTFILNINAINDSPVIISYSPEELTFEIEEEQEIDFEVVAEDIDSELEYAWFVNQDNVNNPDSVFTYNFTETGDFEIKCVVNDEEFELVTIWNTTVNITGINDDALIPLATKLIGSFPNPFNPSTTIKYNLKENAEVRVDIFNIKGQNVNTLIDQNVIAGYHSVVWFGQDSFGNPVSSGLYLYRLIINNRTIDMKKCLLLK